MQNIPPSYAYSQLHIDAINMDIAYNKIDDCGAVRPDSMHMCAREGVEPVRDLGGRCEPCKRAAATRLSIQASDSE